MNCAVMSIWIIHIMTKQGEITHFVAEFVIQISSHWSWVFQIMLSIPEKIPFQSSVAISQLLLLSQHQRAWHSDVRWWGHSLENMFVFRLERLLFLRWDPERIRVGVLSYFESWIRMKELFLPTDHHQLLSRIISVSQPREWRCENWC